MKKSIKNIAYFFLISVGIVSCNKFLDREPLSNITPETYLRNEDDLATYTVSRYNFPTHGGWGIGTFSYDNHTDNQAASGASNIWAPGQIRVPESGGGWNFGQIRQLNYFLGVVIPRYENNEIAGNMDNIRHYIGEAYFLRAYEYFNKLKAYGDFPIIKTVQKDVREELIEASKRHPRNEVARFILSDLDEAMKYLKPGPVSNKNRISREVAQLFKSRVALYEGTWLKHHAGTAFVPGGPGWPGASQHQDFSLDIEAESNFFFEQAMNASKAVADAFSLVESNHQLNGKDALLNPYFRMFADPDMAGYSEVLLWRDYEAGLVGHHTMHYLTRGANTGYTKGFVDSFLMKNGLPIYANGSQYKGDDEIVKVRDSRDERLQLFMAAPGDLLVYEGVGEDVLATQPDILAIPAERSITGYNVKKGIDGTAGESLAGEVDVVTGSIVFRATEAYLNYLEASYEKNGSLDGKATEYWRRLRRRAGLPEDPSITINATDLSKEDDWGKYSAGNLVDVTLYNIRRERRNEFIAEGMRMDDLKRWRALDQVHNYVIEGFNLWESAYDNEIYKNDDGTSKLRALPEDQPNVSSQSLSDYLRPYQIVEANNKFYNGYNWTPAHYLNPIAAQHFVNASSDGNVGESVIYQNPGWPTESGGTPVE